jgi:hypothetical protein
LEKMQNLQNVKLFRSDQTFYIKWKPRIEVDVPPATNKLSRGDC